MANWNTELQAQYPAAVYVDASGPVNGDGSDTKPITSFPLTASDIIVGSGVLYDQVRVSHGSRDLIADGNVILQGDNAINFTSQMGICKGIHFKNYDRIITDNIGQFFDCIIEESTLVASTVQVCENVLYINCPKTNALSSNNAKKQTFINTDVKLAGTHGVEVIISGGTFEASSLTLVLKVKYYCFIPSTPIRLYGGGQGNDEATYTALVGATSADRINNLRTRAALVYGGVASDYFPNCISDDPLFVDPANGNYYLQPNSPCATLAQDGSFIGAYGVYNNYTSGDYESLTNFNVSGNDLIWTDTNLPAEALSKCVFLNALYELDAYNMFTEEDRPAGKTIDATPQIGSGLYVAGANELTIGFPYFVRNGFITHNGYQVAPNEVFIAETDDYSTVDNGEVYDLLEMPNRKTVLFRFAGLGQPINTPGALAAGFYYGCVTACTITINGFGQAYAAGDTVKVDTGDTATLDSGTVQTGIAVNAPWHAYEQGKKIEANTFFNDPLNPIEKGNGSTEYDYAAPQRIVCAFYQWKIVGNPIALPGG